MSILLLISDSMGPSGTVSIQNTLHSSWIS